MTVIGEILTSGNGLGVDIEWTIRDFFSLSKKDGKWHSSPEFSFSGHIWCAWIHPYCQDYFKSSKHVGLTLLRRSSGPPIRLEISLSIKTVNGEKYYETHYTDVFDEFMLYDAPLLVSRSELSRKRSKLMPSGFLTLVCTMKRKRFPRTAIAFERNPSLVFGNTASAECCHCKVIFSADSLSSHQKKCMHRPIKCPDCLGIVVLQKWLDEHGCQGETSEEGKRLNDYPRNTSVETCTQMVEEKVSPEERDLVSDVKHFLEDKRGVDVTFDLEILSGKTQFFAHQLILALRSPYFTDMFYNNGRNKGPVIIPLKEINPKAFEQMIRYCYDYEPCLKTAEDACSLLKVAFDFKLVSLQNLCLTFLRHIKIEPGNVFCVLEVSEQMDDKSLGDMCKKILQEKTREVLASYELSDITPAMVHTILNLPKLSLNSEYELIHWIFEWAEVKSEDEDSDCENPREYLEKLLQEMHFLDLTFEEFAMLCKDNKDFFNSAEIGNIFLNIAFPGTREMPAWYKKVLKCRNYTG